MRILSQLLARELHLAYYLVNGIQNHMHPRSLTIPVVKIPVSVTMMMVLLLRNVDAIVEEKMKEKLYHVTMSHAKSNSFILNA